jgi:PQQ-dependent dehydrogenase (methanol/ethanol family)
MGGRTSGAGAEIAARFTVAHPLYNLLRGYALRLFALILFTATLSVAQTNPLAGDPKAADSGKGMFRIRCAACHGIRAQGGRGPDLTRGTFSCGNEDADLFRTISNGVSGTEMGAYAGIVEDDGIWRLISYIRSVNRHDNTVLTGDRTRGERLFWTKGQCGSCHTVGARGGPVAPPLTRIGRQRSLEYLRDSILQPNADITPGYNTITVVARDGKRIVGVDRGFDTFSARLMDLQGKLHSFQKSDVTSMEREVRSIMPDTYGKLFSREELDDVMAYLGSLRGEIGEIQDTAPAAADRLVATHKDPATWVTYGKNYSGWRYSELEQINTNNVARLAPAWMFQTGVVGKAETTPLIYDGLMFLTGPSNHAWALDARSGRRIWHYSSNIPQGVNVCCGQVNRGFASTGDRLFKVNVEDTLVALDAKTGAVLWETVIEDFKKGYSGTLAPLVVKNMVLVGTAGAEFGTRGFVDAYDATTGKRLWRFYTVAGPGERGGETWGGDSWQRGGGSTWITGTYDPALNLTYWGTGNPGPDMNGDVRPGDNLYTCSVVALDADTGKLKWHFQMTPHDVHDWDAISDPVLMDLDVSGRKVKALIQANRNGHFYALDRTNGKMLFAKPYTKVTWADGIGPDGRPKLVSGQDPTEEGNTSCPGIGGGHNWQATAFSPQTGLYYFGTTDGCHVYYKTTHDFTEGQWYQLSTVEDVHNQPNSGSVVAIEPATGKIRWRFPTVRSPSGGLLATGGGLVFVGDSDGYLIAFDARSGKVLWKFQTGATIGAPPVTYLLDGKQYVAVAAGPNMMTFAVR